MRRGSCSILKVLSSVVVCSVSQLLNVLTFMGGVEIGDGSDGSGELKKRSKNLPFLVSNTVILLNTRMWYSLDLTLKMKYSKCTKSS